MSYDDYDAAYDSWMDDLYREHKAEAIAEFTNERLRSYFLENPLVAQPAHRAFTDAIRLKEAGFGSAAFLFAHISAESAVKAALLRPIISGLVHDALTAGLVADLAVSHTGWDRFRSLLFQALKRVAGVDLASYVQPGSARLLWDDFGKLQKLRNKIVHRAEAAGEAEVESAICVAQAFLQDIFPAVVNSIGLHLHEESRVCCDELCRLECLYRPALIVGEIKGTQTKT